MTFFAGAVTVLARLAAVCWMLRARRLAALVAHLSAELDQAFHVAASLAADRGESVWRRRAEVALRIATLADERLRRLDLTPTDRAALAWAAAELRLRLDAPNANRRIAVSALHKVLRATAAGKASASEGA